jgi:hypothetical protein
MCIKAIYIFGSLSKIAPIMIEKVQVVKTLNKPKITTTLPNSLHKTKQAITVSLSIWHLGF